MSTMRRVVVQARFTVLSFRRNPAATFFTVIMPIVFLLLFTSIFGNDTIGASRIRVANFYVPGILALSVISATFQNLAMTTVTLRENNILKRVRGTPLPTWIFIAGHVVAATVITVVMTVLVIGIGWLLFDVTLRANAIPGLVISLVLGTAAFCALGLALTTVIPSEKAAPAITNIVSLPLFFVSDIFIPPGQNTPRIIEVIGDLFPVKHLANALFDSFDPFASGTPMPWEHWAVIVGWGVFGAVVALTRFRWT